MGCKPRLDKTRQDNTVVAVWALWLKGVSESNWIRCFADQRDSELQLPRLRGNKLVLITHALLLRHLPIPSNLHLLGENALKSIYPVSRVTSSTTSCITLHYIELHYITLHYITLHYLMIHTLLPLFHNATDSNYEGSCLSKLFPSTPRRTKSRGWEDGRLSIPRRD